MDYQSKSGTHGTRKTRSMNFSNTPDQGMRQPPLLGHIKGRTPNTDLSLDHPMRQQGMNSDSDPGASVCLIPLLHLTC
jgi:hypothetical protein